MANKLSICNNALSEIGAGAIESLEEKSVEAENANRIYDQVLGEALEKDESGASERRAVLALTTNDRVQDWLYAYATPEDCAKPLAIYKHDPASALTSFPTVGPYAFPPTTAFGAVPFDLADGKIYTNVETAGLEYRVSSVDPNTLPALMRRAIELELAARLAMPVKKDKELRAQLKKEADVAMQFAIAEGRNRIPTQRDQTVSEVSYARAGYAHEAL